MIKYIIYTIFQQRVWHQCNTNAAPWGRKALTRTKQHFPLISYYSNRTSSVYNSSNTISSLEFGRTRNHLQYCQTKPNWPWRSYSLSIQNQAFSKQAMITNMKVNLVNINHQIYNTNEHTQCIMSVNKLYIKTTQKQRKPRRSYHLNSHFLSSLNIDPYINQTNTSKFGQTPNF